MRRLALSLPAIAMAVSAAPGGRAQSKELRIAIPKLIDIFVAALNEANELIRTDPKKAATLYLEESKEKYSADEIVGIIAEPGTVFATVPRGTLKFSAFMHKVAFTHKVGLLDQKSASWKDFFFPVMHGVAGD